MKEHLEDSLLECTMQDLLRYDDYNNDGHLSLHEFYTAFREYLVRSVVLRQSLCSGFDLPFLSVPRASFEDKGVFVQDSIFTLQTVQNCDLDSSLVVQNAKRSTLPLHFFCGYLSSLDLCINCF